MSRIYTLCLLSVLLLSCSTEDQPYSYLSRPDADANQVWIDFETSSDMISAQLGIQAKELYILWGDGAPASEYVFLGKEDQIPTIEPFTKVFTKQGQFSSLVKALTLIKLDLSKSDIVNQGITVKNLNFQNCPNLADLRFVNQPVDSIDLSTLQELSILHFGSPNTVLGVSDIQELKNLRNLEIGGPLKSIDLNLSRNDSLEVVSIHHANFSSIQFNHLKILSSIRLANLDKLESIVLAENPSLRTISLINNKTLDAVSLNTLFTSLPVASNKESTIVLSGNKGDATCDKTIATRKGWIVR